MDFDSSQAATALLTEHLQYTPLVSISTSPVTLLIPSQALIDDIIDMVNNLIYQGVASLENGLFSTPPERLGFKAAKAEQATGTGEQPELEYPDAKQEIEEGLHKLETLLESTVDKNFDKFEIWVLRNVLSVPGDLAKWIRLQHYEVN
jgi:kinetochore protein Mis12/MTW1